MTEVDKLVTLIIEVLIRFTVLTLLQVEPSWVPVASHSHSAGPDLTKKKLTNESRKSSGFEASHRGFN